MKFDCAIMNPPYDKNLHLKILEKLIEISDNVVSIQPITWAAAHNFNAPKGKWRAKLKGKIKDLDFIPHREANDLFNLGNAIEDLGILYCVSNGADFDIENYGFKNKIYRSLFEKINIYNNDEILTMSSAKSRKEYGWTEKDFINNRPKYYVPVYQWHGGNDCYDAVVIKDENKISKGVSYFKFNNENEKQNFLNSLKTNFMNFYYENFIVPGDFKLQAYMFRLKDYSQPVTDATFYKLFNLTKDEIIIIEKYNKVVSK